MILIRLSSLILLVLLSVSASAFCPPDTPYGQRIPAPYGNATSLDSNKGSTAVTKDFLLIKFKDAAPRQYMLVMNGKWVDTMRVPTIEGVYVKYTDTGAMLLPYLRKTDTAVMLIPYIKWGDTSSIIATKFDISNFADRDTVFVSDIPNIHQNSNVITGGGTNDRNLIQAVLDLNPKVLIQDGASLIDSTLIIGSNTTFIGLGDHTGFFLDSGSRAFMIINRGGYAGNAGIVDSNITIGNMYLNGNGMDQIDPVQGGSITGGYGINIINLFGVKNFRMEGLTTTKGAQWGIGLFNCKYGDINKHVHLMDWTYYSNYTVGQYTAGKVPLSQDAINFRGGCEWIVYRNARISSSDDALAINPIRYAADPVGLNHDPVRHILCDNIFLENSALGVAVYSDTLVEDIHFTNLSGTAQVRWGYVGANAAASGQILGYNGGKQRDVTFTNINVRKIDTFANTFNYQSPYWFVIDGNTEGTLSLNNYNVDSMQSYPYIIFQRPGFNSDQLNFELNMVDKNNQTFGYPRVSLTGGGKQLNVNRFNWVRTGGLAQQGLGLDVATGWRSVDLHFHTKGIDTLLSFTGTGTNNVTISGIMDSCATDGSIVNVTNNLATVVIQDNGTYRGETPFLTGNGASTIVTNGLLAKTHHGVFNWTDGRSPFFSGGTLGGGHIMNKVPFSGGYSGRTIGMWNNAGTSFFAGMVFNGNDLSNTSMGIGHSATVPEIFITKPTVAAIYMNMASNGRFSFNNGSGDLGYTVGVNGSFGVENGNVTFTNSSNAFLFYRRDINIAGAGLDFQWQLKNSTGSYVSYFVASGQIESNTAGSHNGRIVFAPAVNGTITEKARMTSAGRWGIDVTNPTAFMHLRAGAAAASSAPLKFTSGPNLTTPEAGAVEFDGTNYFVTSSTTRYTLAKTLTNTATLDFGNTLAQTSADLTITVTGAAVGDAVSLGIPAADANSCYTAYVSATNTVTVRFNNYSAGAIDPASGTFRVSVIKY